MRIAFPDEGFQKCKSPCYYPGMDVDYFDIAAKSQEWIPAFSPCEPKLIHTDTSTNAKARLKSYSLRGGVAFFSDLLTSRVPSTATL